MDDTFVDLFSHRVVTEPLASSDANTGDVETSIFSDCANAPVPVAGTTPE